MRPTPYVTQDFISPVDVTVAEAVDEAGRHVCLVVTVATDSGLEEATLVLSEEKARDVALRLWLEVERPAEA